MDSESLSAEAVTLLTIYLSGGSLPGNVNPLVLIEMAKESGEYTEILAESKAIRAVRQRIRDHSHAQEIGDATEAEQYKSYLLAIDKTEQEEIERLFWLIESLEFGNR